MFLAYARFADGLPLFVRIKPKRSAKPQSLILQSGLTLKGGVIFLVSSARTIPSSSVGIDPHITRAALIPKAIYETLRHSEEFMSVLPSIPAKAGRGGEMRDAAKSAA